MMRVPDEKGLDKVEAMKQNYYKLASTAWSSSAATARRDGQPPAPKRASTSSTCPRPSTTTSYGTDMTFGFQSAVDIATETIDYIHTTAASHNRVFIVEIMGHKVGWLTLHAGIAGGADIILIPRSPTILTRSSRPSSTAPRRARASPSSPWPRAPSPRRTPPLSKKDLKGKQADYKYPSVSYEIAEKIAKKTGIEIRVTVPGHMQRGGSPCRTIACSPPAWAREAANLILKEQYGYIGRHHHMARSRRCLGRGGR